jgi:outer membrane receptor protein involved in Fe transport
MKISNRSANAWPARLLILTALLAVLWISSAPAHCADTAAEKDQTNSLKELSLAELGNLQVTTATKEPEAIWKTPAAIYVITHEAIIRSGATSIPEALRLAPGVEVARIDNDKWSIGIRGFGSRLCRSVLVLIDGRTVYTTLLAGTYWEVQDTVMQDIDRIEVIRGPGGTIWGPNAVNGVINVITKPASETQGTYAEVLGGNVEQGSVTIRQGGNRGSVDYRAYAKGFNRAAQFHSDDREFDHWRAMQGGFRIDWAESQRDGYTLQGDITTNVPVKAWWRRLTLHRISRCSTATLCSPAETFSGAGRERRAKARTSRYKLSMIEPTATNQTLTIFGIPTILTFFNASGFPGARKFPGDWERGPVEATILS